MEDGGEGTGRGTCSLPSVVSKELRSLALRKVGRQAVPLATVIGKLDLPSRGRDFLSLTLPHIYVCWYVDICSSVCGHVCADECAHVCARRWRPEGNVEYQPG